VVAEQTPTAAYCQVFFKEHALMWFKMLLFGKKTFRTKVPKVPGSSKHPTKRDPQNEVDMLAVVARE
jgi:hypothetical protein